MAQVNRSHAQRSTPVNLKPWHILSSDNEELRERALSEPLRARKSWRYRIVGDLFAKLPVDKIASVLGVVAASSRHEFEVVTLCPERAGEFYKLLDEAAAEAKDTDGLAWGRARLLWHCVGKNDGGYSLAPALPWPLPNLRLTTHVTTQAEADARIPALLACPAASYGLTMTPTEGIDIRPWQSDNDGCEDCDDNGIGGPGHCRRSDIPRCEQCPTKFAVFENDERGTRKTLALVTVQGAAGPVHPDWVRSIRDQCKAAGVPFRFEGWGRWFDLTNDAPCSDRHIRAIEDRVILPSGKVIGAGCRIGRQHTGGVAPDWKERGAAWMARIGRESAGRLLDGVTHGGERP